ncbi:MAG TPA: hypothetical protein VF487_09035, partial [Chitinophagaceae bacterium]
WKGRINKQKVEVKIIQQGDSLTGTSYYYESPDHYRRYSIKGYFNTATNEAVWWDDQLIEEKTGKFSLSAPGKNPLLSSADFNCPGGGKMMLDGKAGKKDDRNPKGEVHLDKVPDPSFEDEWDFVIDNYTVGGNDPDLIDSIGLIAQQRPAAPSKSPPPVGGETYQTPDIETVPKIESPKELPTQVVKTPEPVKPQTIEEKFISRKKILTKEIPLTGDSIELRFYDNAEIDGDSISLFLNDKLIFRHIRLTGSAYTIKLSIAELSETNELIMVAENLGSIPPNTSYMVALVGDNRYEARLESTEGSSAMVRFVKKPEGQ